jgi:hypothetical protein
VGILVAVLILVLVAIVVAVVSGPLRARGTAARERPGGESEPERASSQARARADLLAELTSAREAKYQEIRDAELDYRTGKLSRSDYESIDASLRAEAIDILDRLEAAQARDEDAGGMDA